MTGHDTVEDMRNVLENVRKSREFSENTLDSSIHDLPPVMREWLLHLHVEMMDVEEGIKRGIRDREECE